ncbi:MAG: LysR family transcriptional regulator [Actinobacteria bacterium]|nr:LysR family transcriptional regulator [Actinomycetota bacterium]
MSGWVGVELRHLAALGAVAEERSFRGAADRLGYVQSAVSQRIAQLEGAVGVRLVERGRGHKEVGLTEAGRSLLRHAERIEAQMGAARLELDELVGERRGDRLRIGASGGPAARLVPAALRRLGEGSAPARIELRESTSDRDLFAAVGTGELDVGLAELPLEGGPFEARTILNDPLVALVPSDSPLAASPSPPGLAELARSPFVVDSTWRMFGLVEAELAIAGLEIEACFRTTRSTVVQALVAAGAGVAIAPRLEVDLDHPGVTVLDLADSLPARTLACYWSAERGADDLAPFLDAMTRACERYRAALLGEPRATGPNRDRPGRGDGRRVTVGADATGDG